MIRRMMTAGLLMAVTATQALAFGEGDSQLWLAGGAETGAGKDVRVGFESGARWGDSMSDYFYQNNEVFVSWKVASWFDAAASFEYITQEKSGRWLEEQVPKVTVQIKGDAGPFVLSNRSRLEYRIREAASDDWRYRDRLRLQLAKGLSAFKIRPYIEDEIYLPLDDEQQFNENRASAGIAIEPHSRVKVELYYMARSTLKDDAWTDSNVIGAKVALQF
jgi:hypothetical protein